MKNLEKILKRGLLWSVLQVIVKRVFDFFVKLVLLNILFPEDFGIISMATAFTSVLYVFSEFGLKNALIQRDDKQLVDLHYQSAFWWAFGWSTFVFLLVYFLGTPLIAKFYEEPILLKIIPLLMFPVITESLSLVYRVKLLRRLNFKVIAIIQNVSTIIAGFIALIFALKGAGIWSIVVYILIPYILSLPLYIVIANWRPKFIFSVTHFKEIFKFSFYTFMTALIIVVAGNLDYFIIGKMLGAESLGVYSLAVMLTLLLSAQITSMIDRVLFPFYSKVQNNVRLVKAYFLKSLAYYSVMLFPIMLCLIVLAHPLIKIFFDKKWIDAKTSIRILACAVVIKVLTHGATVVYRSLGKPKIEMYIFLTKSIFITLPAVYIGSLYGIDGVSLGLFIATALNFFIGIYFLNKELSISFKDILIRLKAPIYGFLITFTILLPLYLYSGLHFILLFTILIAVYSTVIYYFHGKNIKLLIRKVFQQ